MTRTEWNNNPSAQKKTYIAAGILGFMLLLLWLPSLHSLRHIFSPKRGTLTTTPAQRAVDPRPQVHTPPGPPPAAPAPNSVVTAFTGKWQGHAALPPQHGFCTLTLEIGSNPDGTSSGYSTLACQPPPSDYAGGRVRAANQLLMGSNPSSAILTGTTDASGVLHFKVTQNIGVAQANHGCNMLSADATPFGQGRIAFEWHEENCLGGQMVMTRLR